MKPTDLGGLDHWLKEVAATDVVLYERWMNNEIMVRNSVSAASLLLEDVQFSPDVARVGLGRKLCREKF